MDYGLGFCFFKKKAKSLGVNIPYGETLMASLDYRL